MKKNRFKRTLKNFRLQKTDIVFLFFLAVALWLIYNLYILQVINGQYYNDKILAQNNNYSNAKIFYRGDIYFQNRLEDKILVATQKYGWTLAINPKILKNSADVGQKLSQIIDLDEEDFKKKAAKSDDPYEELQNRLNDEEAEQIRELGIKGVILVRENWRHYPFNSLASKALGFLDIDRQGVYGIEKQYDEILQRDAQKKDRSVFWRIFAQKDDRDLFFQKNISKEGDLISSIDLEVQKVAESALQKINDKYSSVYSAAIVVRPESGEIVALADTQNFDLNDDKQDFRNEFVEHVFEVGSIFKPLVVAIGLETGVIDTDFSYDDKGCDTIHNFEICNFDERARGPHTSLYTTLAQSLNLGMVEIGDKIGQENFFEYLLKLDLAEETGVDLPGEVPSNISSLDHDIKINYATAAFGQGVAFTPIGIMRALTSLANDGFLVEPHLIKEINYGELIPAKNFVTEKEQVFSPSTIKDLKDMMVRRSTESDFEKQYAKAGYAMATKTGTAQIPDASGSYEVGVNNHFFFGFFPAYAKVEDRYAVLLFTIRPQGVRYASVSMAPPFYEIANFIISHHQIEPDRPNLEF